LELGQRWALKVDELYNLMAIWSIMIAPTIKGSYSWYNLRRGKEVTREPWHQHVDIQEAQDVFRRLEQLKEAGVLAEKIGVVIDFKEIEATLKKLEPKNNLNLEGQVIYFPRLYEKRMEEREEGEIDNISLVPLYEELNLLSGEWMKEKQNPTTKVEESEE
jgi:hypothetical protein